MAAAYSFPPLPPAEVVTCLAELGCTVTEAQLAKPEAEWVGALFEELVCLLVGVSRCAPRRRGHSEAKPQHTQLPGCGVPACPAARRLGPQPGCASKREAQHLTCRPPPRTGRSSSSQCSAL